MKAEGEDFCDGTLWGGLVEDGDSELSTDWDQIYTDERVEVLILKKGTKDQTARAKEPKKDRPEFKAWDILQEVTERTEKASRI